MNLGKKTLAVLLILTMLFTFVFSGCNSGGESTADSDVDSSVDSQNEEEPSADDGSYHCRRLAYDDFDCGPELVCVQDNQIGKVDRRLRREENEKETVGSGSARCRLFCCDGCGGCFPVPDALDAARQL